MKFYYCLGLLLSAHVVCCAELGLKVRAGERSVDRGASGFGGHYELFSQAEQLAPRLPIPAKEAGELDGRYDRSSQRHGFGKLGHKTRLFGRDFMHGYGQFNSDTYACSGIQSRRCAARADCAGCLGLYTCDVAIGKCKLKGLSRRTDGFFLTLEDP